MAEHSKATQNKLDDITRELRERETGSELSQLFRRMLDATDNTIVISDPNLPDNPLIYVNKQFENLTGYSYDEVVGQNCRFLQGDDREQADLEELRAAVREGRNTRVELRNYRKDGSMFWNEVHLTAVRDEDGNLMYFFGVQNDITRLKLLLEAERDLREALGERLAFVMVLDMGGRVKRVDATMLEKAGLQDETVQGELLERTPWWSHSERAQAIIRNCVAAAARGEGCRTDADMKQAGEIRTVELWFTPQRDKSGALVQVVATGVDVSERRKAEDDLKALMGTLEQRIDERTQDVRRLASELTLAENRERHRIAQLLHDHVQQEIYAAQFLTVDLRSAVRESYGEVTEAVETVIDELHRQLKAAVATARGLTSDLSPPVLRGEGFHAALSWIVNRAREQYGLEIVLDAQDDLPVPHEALRVLLLSVVRELLFNVVKHAQTEQVWLTAALDDDHLCVEVRDGGIGFEPSRIEHEMSSVTGFGLYSIQERLRLFGGKLELDSQPGEGTSITIRLPLASLSLA